jgi:drug/metabolite transporter (DMT)-like permease
MNTAQTDYRPATMKLVLAFAAVYIIWGSTYLGILYAIETLPPLLMAGSRFIIAGTVLYAWARMKGAERPGFRGWRKASVIGALLLLGGNGMVVLAERTVPSGLAALLIATEPLMIVLLDWFRPGGARPIGKVVVGLILGFSGMALLVGPAGIAGGSAVDPFGAGMLIFASLSWATGSLYAARSRTQTDPVMGAAMQMLTGGALLLIVGLIRGEAASFAISEVSLRSLGAFLYLIIFGSLVGFTSYSWLLRVTRPAVASTYAYVNPIVAVMLGWAFAGEVISLRTIVAAAIIIGSVVMISAGKESKPENDSSDRSDVKIENRPTAQDLCEAPSRAGD